MSIPIFVFLQKKKNLPVGEDFSIGSVFAFQVIRAERRRKNTFCRWTYSCNRSTGI